MMMFLYYRVFCLEFYFEEMRQPKVRIIEFVLVIILIIYFAHYVDSTWVSCFHISDLVRLSFIHYFE